MVIFRSSEILEWGSLDLPILGADQDWHGLPFWPPAGYSVTIDPEWLWFIAGRNKPAQPHPDSSPGLFKPQLWRHDVAELFLGEPGGGRYLEFHLAPNAAWWSCVFQGPRIRMFEKDIPLAGVGTWATLAADGSWMAAAALPLQTLRDLIGFDDNSTANVAFILKAPEQRFITVTDLGGGEPDFHRPDRFEPMEIELLPALSAAMA